MGAHAVARDAGGGVAADGRLDVRQLRYGTLDPADDWQWQERGTFRETRGVPPMDGPTRSFGADFDPLSEIYLADPYPFLVEAREAAPVFYCDAIDHWIVTRYHDIRNIFRTPGLFSRGPHARQPRSATAHALAQARQHRLHSEAGSGNGGLRSRSCDALLHRALTRRPCRHRAGPRLGTSCSRTLSNLGSPRQ